jgi:hypothetical protein
MGAICPGRWQLTQFLKRMGATSLVKFGVAIAIDANDKAVASSRMLGAPFSAIGAVKTVSLDKSLPVSRMVLHGRLRCNTVSKNAGPGADEAKIGAGELRAGARIIFRSDDIDPVLALQRQVGGNGRRFDAGQGTRTLSKKRVTSTSFAYFVPGRTTLTVRTRSRRSGPAWPTSESKMTYC